MGPVLVRGDLVSAAVEQPDRLALVDLLDRLLAGGVVLTGDVVLSVAEVDLVHISLRALITSVREGRPAPW
ncbi:MULTISPECIES: gas vesicle protein [Amycolatopsis]|uniref:Gas vesicle protein n=1 Tax=Amycolatopsis albidoflavus TaxID=102226 RepID=A0ABW5I5H1_9PSEU